jgi:hypothetical protein
MIVYDPNDPMKSMYDVDDGILLGLGLEIASLTISYRQRPPF